MPQPDILTSNRVILMHFDSYSAALLFARWGNTLLWPQALPESAQPTPSPTVITPDFLGAAVLQALVERTGLHADALQRVNEFNHWAQTDAGLVRIHLFRFTTLDAPKTAIELLGAEFKPISLLRASAMSELVLLREVFNLIVGSGGT